MTSSDQMVSEACLCYGARRSLSWPTQVFVVGILALGSTSCGLISSSSGATTPKTASLRVLVRTQTATSSTWRSAVSYVVEPVSLTGSSGSGAAVTYDESNVDGDPELEGGEWWCKWTTNHIGMKTGDWRITLRWPGGPRTCVQALHAGTNNVFFTSGAQGCESEAFARAAGGESPMSRDLVLNPSQASSRAGS